MNIAIVSPNYDAYSETFIKAHKQLNANIFYYYGGVIPNYLEGFGEIEPEQGTLNRWMRKISRRFNNETLSVDEIKFIKSLRRNKIDVVFAEYGITGAKLVPACKRIQLPLVTMFHGYDASEKQVIETYFNEYQNLFHYARNIIVVSEIMKEKLITLGCSSDKIIKSIYGPAQKYIEAKPTFSEPESFVALGRFVDKKAPYYTILAIKKVAKTYPHVKLYFGGEGELHETVKNLIRYFNLEKNIALLGIITSDEFVNLLTKSSGFIQHSISSISGDMEGTPVAILEASAAGIPVISTEHAGIPEVIIDGVSGYLSPEHDVESMALNIIKLIQKPDLARELGQRGKENIIRNFSLEKHLQTIISILENATKGNHA